MCIRDRYQRRVQGDREMVSDRPQARALSHVAGFAQHQQHQMTLPRNGSVLDPDISNGDMLMSDASTLAPEEMTPDSIEMLMEDVRRALRGEGSHLSLEAYSTDIDYEDCDDVQMVTPPSRHVSELSPGHTALYMDSV
eukprot:Plantae.Rhodophyta-Palmaria_palmata.ctg106.p1 GENE.Plantae.Rhodophyta-Palmaria_palmata.ctg106~~Plantae.Rhodophyta-Palmaria_palmata.ctg106.p1  ORF type:complete len:138 (+),score=15.39 Plantae.Rhodophyta-Palmaria_palmata.ctg106:1-414(+)